MVLASHCSDSGCKVGCAATSSRPSMGGFGFKPRTSAVFVGASNRGGAQSLLDGEDKEN